MKSEGVRHLKVSGLLSSDDRYSISPAIIAAHELKSPLAVVRQLSMELQGNDTAPEEQKQIVEQIQLITEKSLRFSSNLTKYEQLQSTLFPTRPIHVGELWRDITYEIQPLYRATGKHLKAKQTARIPLIVANYDLLRRIILNFLDNALHYSDSDGAVEMYSQLVASKQYVRLGIRDKGPVLPKDIWNKIQNDSAHSIQPLYTRPNSSGLGLQIVYEFAEVMRASVGTIRHRDGATFYIDLPISKQLSLL